MTAILAKDVEKSEGAALKELRGGPGGELPALPHPRPDGCDPGALAPPVLPLFAAWYDCCGGSARVVTCVCVFVFLLCEERVVMIL